MRAVDVLFVARDESAAAGRLDAALRAGSCTTRRTRRLEHAEHLLRSHRVDVVIVDAPLFDADVLARSRRDNAARALVVWLSRASSDEAARLLEAGADEVLHAAMSDRELLARTVAVASRGARNDGSIFALGPLLIDVEHKEVTWDGAELRLSPRERDVLQALAERAGKTVPRERLYRRVWGYTMARGDRSVDVNVKRLREKLAVAGDALVIRTQPGVGYRLELAPNALDPAPLRDPLPAATE